MADLRVGNKRPKSIILGMHPSTGMPAPVKDVYYGDKWVWSQEVPDIIQEYSMSAGTYTYPLPDYEAEVDVVVVGGGGGGYVGNGGNNTPGRGGKGGSSRNGTLTGIKGGDMKIVVGAGGAGGNPGGGNGEDSMVAIGYKSIVGPGGEGAASAGQGGNYWSSFPDHFGYNHPVDELKLAAGGNGGNGGIFGRYTDGEPGKHGYAWIRIRKVMPN